MEEKKKPEPKPEKKLSRTTLTFYIVGLFSVAIALILISYVAQARADRQLDTLTDQLNEQQTVAQGATQKVEDLQAQFDALNKVREVLDTELAETDVVGATEQRMEERDVYALLARINAQLLADNLSDAKQAYDELVQKYGEDRLLGNTKDGFDADINKLFEAVQQQMDSQDSEEK